MKRISKTLHHTGNKVANILSLLYFGHTRYKTETCLPRYGLNAARICALSRRLSTPPMKRRTLGLCTFTFNCLLLFMYRPSIYTQQHTLRAKRGHDTTVGLFVGCSTMPKTHRALRGRALLIVLKLHSH